MVRHSQESSVCTMYSPPVEDIKKIVQTRDLDIIEAVYEASTQCTSDAGEGHRSGAPWQAWLRWWLCWRSHVLIFADGGL